MHRPSRPLIRPSHVLVLAAIVLAALALCAPADARAQTRGGAEARALVEAIRAHRAAREREILGELVTLLSEPNVASDSAAIRRNAALLVSMLERRGVEARVLEGPAGPPAVYGELRVPGATRTLVFYAHFDGQPVNPAQWASDPWQPTFRDGPLEAGGRVVQLPDTGRIPGEWRLYARSASDDKSPIVAALAALDALRAAGRRPSVNLRFFLEGAEEAGSPGLRPLLERHRDLLAADGWIFADGPVHQSRRPQLVFGVRGITGLDVTVYGPARALHSGHYGNWAPNPAVLLTSLLASMRDADGRILIPGFMDDVRPPSAAERAAIAEIPSVDSALRVELQLARTEAGDAPLLERIMMPALNVRGIRAGEVGAGSTNAIQPEARASIDFRLVPAQTPERVRALVEAHVRAQGFHVVHAEPTAAERRAHPRIARLVWDEDGYTATRTALDAPLSRALTTAVAEATGRVPYRVPTLGGSLPTSIFQDVLGAPLVIVPMVNHDNNQHAANENLRLQNLWDGIEMYGVILARLGALWEAER